MTYFLPLWGPILLATSSWCQQICLTMEGGGKATRPNAPITFDKISTLGTSSQGGPRDPGPPRPPGPPEMSFVMVNVSLAKTTGEIKICGDPDMYENLGGGEQFFYLSVRASRHPRDPSSYPRSAQLFLHVNGKVPLSGQVTQYKMYGGGLQRETAHRVVGLITDKLGALDPHMPLGVINIGDKEASFEAMDFIKHGDVLRIMTGDVEDDIGFVSVCIFYEAKGRFGEYGK